MFSLRYYRGPSIASFETSSDIDIKIFCSLHLCPEKYLSSKLQKKSLELAFDHFYRGQFLDLQLSGRRGWSGGFRAGKKGWYSGLRRDKLLFFLNSFTGFPPTLTKIHEDMGTNIILDAIDKAFPEKSIRHALHAKIQVLKRSYKVFHYARLFQVSQTS
jgi:hypothetical protein